jgi:hypothetical protein
VSPCNEFFSFVSKKEEEHFELLLADTPNSLEAIGVRFFLTNKSGVLIGV